MTLLIHAPDCDAVDLDPFVGSVYRWAPSQCPCGGMEWELQPDGDEDTPAFQEFGYDPTEYYGEE